MLEALFSLCVAISVVGCLFLFACTSADLLDQIVRRAVRDELRRRDERCRLRDLNETPKPDSLA